MIDSGFSFNVSQKEIKRVLSLNKSRTSGKKLTKKNILNGWDSFKKMNTKSINVLSGKTSTRKIANEIRKLILKKYNDLHITIEKHNNECSIVIHDEKVFFSKSFAKIMGAITKYYFYTYGIINISFICCKKTIKH